MERTGKEYTVKQIKQKAICKSITFFSQIHVVISKNKNNNIFKCKR